MPSPSDHSSAAISQARLDAISDACRAPRAWLELRGNQIVIKAAPDDSPELACVLKAVSAVLKSADPSAGGNAEASKEK